MLCVVILTHVFVLSVCVFLTHIACLDLFCDCCCFASNGTSMISLIVPPKDQVSRVNKMLSDELGTATNIKSRVNRLSVLGAITSVQQVR